MIAKCTPLAPGMDELFWKKPGGQLIEKPPGCNMGDVLHGKSGFLTAPGKGSWVCGRLGCANIAAGFEAETKIPSLRVRLPTPGQTPRCVRTWMNLQQPAEGLKGLCETTVKAAHDSMPIFKHDSIGRLMRESAGLLSSEYKGRGTCGINHGWGGQRCNSQIDRADLVAHVIAKLES